MSVQRPRSFHIHTLGCKINQYEAQSLREAWQAAGLEEAEAPERAELVCLNSCAVTARAVRDLRQAVRKAARENPGARIVVTGCAAQVLEEELARLPGVAEVVPQARKAELLARFARPVPAETPDFSVRSYNRARAVFKVQDGCSHGCTYCIVPRTRGASRSRPAQAVVAEAEALLDAGFRELTLSGVNLRHWGRDLPGAPDFWDLAHALEQALAPRWTGRARLRLSSLDPAQLSGKALDTLADSRLFCRHLHLSLQSGSPGVLRRMGRDHYGPEEVVGFVGTLARHWPLFGLGADLLVGFPGESEAEFAETLAACEALPLTYAHVFPYSKRPGTVAARLPDQVPAAGKKARAATLRGLAAERKEAFARRLAQEQELLVALEDDGAGAGPARGLCQYYLECRFANPPGPPARALVPAAPVGAERGLVLVRPSATMVP
jgi:MiaB/RimO family radical SAM methylthiotransferase